MKTKSASLPEDKSRTDDKYWVPIIGKTIDLLECFGAVSESLTLEQIVQRTAIAHTTAFRILHTLVLRDYLSQTGRHYHLSHT